MDSQGLPVKFIVLLAIGILILVLLVFFVYIGYSPNKNVISKENALNNCKELCVEDENYIMGRTGSPGIVDIPVNYNFKFCSVKYNIQGMGNGIKCDQLYTCVVQDADGDSCTISCNNNGGSCS